MADPTTSAGNGNEPAYQPSPEELEQIMQLLEAAEGRAGLGSVPQELKDMMNAVKRAKGQPTEDTPTEEITPEPGFVIKTADDQGRKVFINICHSNKVPAPGGWTGGLVPESVLKALEQLGQDSPQSEAAAEALRFPLSCSELLADTDKQGEPCSTADCIVHSDIMAGAQQNRHLKAFLVELAIEWVGSKHQLNLSQKFKLPKMAYKGAQVRPQRVRAEKKALVTDVTSHQRDQEQPSFALRAGKPAAKAAAAPAAAKQAPAGTAAAAAAGARQQQRANGVGAGSSSGSSGWQHEITCEGQPVSSIVVKLQLPPSAAAAAAAACSGSGGSSGCGITAEVCGPQLRVAVPGPSHEPCLLQLPFAAAADGAEAVLQQGSGQLLLRLPYLPVQQWVQQLQAQAPLAFQQLPLASHAAYTELE